MIARLRGRPAGHGAEGLILDVNGVGYLVHATPRALANADGAEMTVETYLHVREDALSLYGFADAEERELFIQLLSVSGIGPKVALAIVSGSTPGELKRAIAREDTARFQAIPGIGKKTAQRIILDLKDKLGVPDLGAPGSGRAAGVGAALAETTDALLAMGFSASEVSAAVRGFDGRGDASALLKHALRWLGGGV